MSAVALEPEIERRLEISDRHVWNAIHEMIQQDPMKALVELITNADDSYARLEAVGVRPTGRIVVEVEEHRGGVASALRVRDDGEGFRLDDLDRAVGRMGEATSGLDADRRVRGMWGDGLKEAVLGLGVGGRVVSIRDGLEVSASLRWGPDREPLYRRPREAAVATPERRRALGIEGNGTVVEALVDTRIGVPRHATLVHHLSLHYALRDLLARPDRFVVVRRLSEGHVLHEDRVTWREPAIDEEFAVDEVGRVPGFPGASFTLRLRRATEPLTGPEAGAYRLGGLVVQSRGALVDVGWFGHEHRPGTERLFGRVVCDALYERLRAGDLALTRNRTGLNRDNPFARALIEAIEAHTEHWLVAEERRAAVGPERVENAGLRRCVRDVVAELNRIAAIEKRHAAEVSTAPLAFAPSRATVTPGGEIEVRVRALEGVLRDGVEVSFAVEGGALALVGPAIAVVGQDPLVARVRGVHEGKALVHARCPGHETTASVAVRSAAPPPRPQGPRAHGAEGPIRDLRFDEREDPDRRFQFADGVITLFVRDRSVRRYLAGPDDRSSQLGRAILAELVLQAFCEVLTTRHDEAAHDGAAAVHLYDDLLHRYGERIHSVLNPR